MSSKLKVLGVICIAGILMNVSCDGGGSSSDSNVKKEYGEATENVMTRVKVKQPDGTYGYRIGKIAADQTINNVVYNTYQLTNIDMNGNVIAGVQPTDLYIKPLPLGSDGKITVGGFDKHDGTAITIDPAVTLDSNAPVGVAQAVSTTVNGSVTGGVVITNATAAGSYTLVTTGESVATEMGVVPDCNHFTANVTIDGEGAPAVFKGKNFTGDLWHNPTLGIVKYSIPDLGIEGGMQGTWDVDDPTGEYRTIKMTGIVSAENPYFKLSTYSVSNDLDADKNTHAKMLVELRWADEETAKTGPMPAYPYINVSFETVTGGTFPYQLVESPYSIFFPEENGKGFKYWYGYVDQAAKNIPGSNGISYSIVVSRDTSAAPVRVTGRIHYRTVTE